MKVEITWNWFKSCKKRAKFCFKNKKTKEIWTIYVSHLANWEWINRTNHGKGKKFDLALRLQRFVLSTSFWFFSLHLAGIFQPCLCTSHLFLTQGNLSVMFSTFVWPVCYKFYMYCKQITQIKKKKHSDDCEATSLQYKEIIFICYSGIINLISWLSWCLNVSITNSFISTIIFVTVVKTF